MVRNYILQEAVDTSTGAKVEPAVAGIKKLMNTCKLTKFKSADSCGRFFSSFFLCTLEDDIHPTVEQWGTIYSTLLSNDKFCEDLACYMAMYQPAIYTGLFAPLWNLINSELLQLRDNRVRYLSLTKATLSMIQTRLAGVGNLVRAQVIDTEVVKFVTVVDQTLNKMIVDISTLTQTEIAKSVKPDDIVITTASMQPLAEDIQELFALFESCNTWVDSRTTEIMNEGIINNAKEKAKAALVAKKKAEKEFDEFCMKKVRKMREERRNRKHAEMVGEALRVNHELKRILRSGAIGILNPALGVISFVVSVVYDRATDKKDREVLVGQLKDELEIVEEKIQMAERNGDEKARIELIRFRQKLQREYERIQRMRWDASTRAKMNR